MGVELGASLAIQGDRLNLTDICGLGQGYALVGVLFQIDPVKVNSVDFFEPNGKRASNLEICSSNSSSPDASPSGAVQDSHLQGLPLSGTGETLPFILDPFPLPPLDVGQNPRCRKRS